MKELYTVTEAAEALRLSRMTIYNMVKSGRLLYAVDEDEQPTRKFLATDLDQVRHERIVEAHEELVRRQAVPTL